MRCCDKIQAKIEVGLLNARGSSLHFMAMVDSEQITGATMLHHNIPYDEARGRVSQALKSIAPVERRG